MKKRTIILHKDELLYDIEALAYKLAEGTALEGKAKNTLAADHNETLDGRLLGRMIDVRHATLRKKLTFALSGEQKDSACNAPSAESDIVFYLSVPDSLDDGLIDVVKTYMHEYIVRGVLLDWYKRLGLQTAAVSEIDVQEMHDNVISILRGPSYMKAPLQPWGPR